ncbi:MAG: TldD/PmbA family protein [Bryobacteraceae bacterium]
MASEIEPLTRRWCEKIFGAVRAAAVSSGVSGVEATISCGSHALTRFANNTIHQNVAERGAGLSVRAVIDGRTARASTNRLDADSIRKVVEESIALTRLQERDPDLPPLAEPEAIEPVERHFDSTANATPLERAQAAAAMIAEAESRGFTAAGIYSTGESAFAILNSRGVFAYHSETMTQASITVMGPDSSGWAKRSACDRLRLDPAALARVAAEKAEASRRPVELPPGRYTVILEPAAVLDLAGQMFFDFSGTALRDGRSFLLDRVGTKLFGENVDIVDDVFHAGQSGAPFDGEGVPRRRLRLVERGVISDVAYSRQAALAAGASPTGHGFPAPNETGEAPVNVVFGGGSTSVEEMIRSSERAILVTRLWYIREVDPYQKIMTGMTRDGTFLVEGGEIRRGLRNFRFNQSLVDLLQSVLALSPAMRFSGEEAFDMVAPAMKAADFNFTEVTRF